MRLLAALKALILNTLFPPVCSSCRREGSFLCEDCIADFTKRKISPDTSAYQDPDTEHLDGVIYGLDYGKNPQIQAALKQFKYRFTTELADYFADLIAEKLSELHMTQDRKLILVPVPLHKKRLNYRGFNQAEVIAKAVSDRLGDQAEIQNLLTRTKHTSQQARLSKKERHENLAEAFETARAWGPNSIGGLVGKGKEKKMPIYFIVDDVFTTGATLESCAQTLKNSGLEKAYGLVVARSFDEGSRNSQNFSRT